MRDTLKFVIDHGYSVLFLWVAAEQMGLPIPAIPILLAAGALSGTGHMNLGLSLLLAVIGAVISDTVWFQFGRHRGAAVLNLLCRISLEPDSCVRRTESIYERHGSRSLLVSKFLPGLSTAAPPVAGMFRMPLSRFVFFDALGALIWSGTFVALGFLFADQLEDVAMYVSRLGGWLLVLLLVGLAAYILAKWRQRRAFLRTLVADRIAPDELLQKIERAEPLAIVDLRHPLDLLPDPRAIPGAIRLTAEELELRHDEIPRDREIILYCT